ncbi:hypothetical protein [Agrobacterium rosae]|uniref:Transposase n=1 Tax=Agrobacterium rosae TaxID=1972867 RepID=A0AAW9FND7_9HYPH|nr:hypothetical protein [Agrobacterium rosae]MDX8303999.1 hypothetical protein [Agrobacterium rosae]
MINHITMNAAQRARDVPRLRIKRNAFSVWISAQNPELSEREHTQNYLIRKARKLKLLIFNWLRQKNLSGTGIAASWAGGP